MKYKFECPLTQIPVTLILGRKDQLRKIVSDNVSDNCHDAEVCVLSDKNDIVKGILVWILDSTAFYSMVHETVHLVQDIFEITGIPFDANNQEIIAYYQNFWVRKFWNKMSKFKDKKGT